jgi:hypothetical protein
MGLSGQRGQQDLKACSGCLENSKETSGAGLPEGKGRVLGCEGREVTGDRALALCELESCRQA